MKEYEQQTSRSEKMSNFFGDNNFPKLNRYNIFSIFIMITGCFSVIASHSLDIDFEQGTSKFELQNAKTAAPGYLSSHCMQLDGSSAKSWVVSPVFHINESSRYDIRLQQKGGKGLLWIHAWCYDSEGKYIGDLSEPQQGKHLPVDGQKDWVLRGIRGAAFPKKAVTIRFCFEYRGLKPLFIDNIAIAEAAPPAKEYNFELSTNQKYLHVGEWLEVQGKVSDYPDAAHLTCDWTYCRNNVAKSYGWPEEADKLHYKSSPRLPGQYTLQATLNDELGAIAKASIPITVLPNEPPCPIVSVQYLSGGQVLLDASASSDSDGDKIIAYQWSLPDGQIKNGAVCKLDASDFKAFNVYLTISDQWGLEGQKEVEVQLPTPPQTVAPTISTHLTVNIDPKGKIYCDKSFSVLFRLGMPEYLPFLLKNDSKHTVQLTIAGRSDSGNTVISPVILSIPAKKTINCVVRAQTWLNVSHQTMLTLNTGSEKREIPMAISIEEHYPIFGTQEHFNRSIPGHQQAEKDMAQLAALPCQLFRLPDILCWYIRKTNSDKITYDFSDGDWLVEKLLSIGKTQLNPFLGYVPNDLRPLDKDFSEKAPQYRSYVQAVVSRYKNQIHYWEPYNEPPWHALDNYTKNGADVFASLTEILAKVVRTEDPKGKILAPGYCRSEDFPIIEKILKNGGDRDIDIYNIHEYTTSTGERTLGTTRSFDNSVENGNVMQLLKLLREYNITKPIFVTECGGHIAPVCEEDNRIKALQFLRTCLIWLAEGVKGIQQYEFFDYPHESLPPFFSLMRHTDYYKFPIFYSFRETIKSFTGAETNGSVVTLPNGAVRYATFQRGNERIIAIWNCEAKPQGVTITFPANKIAYLQEKSFNYGNDPFVTSFTKPIDIATMQSECELKGYQVKILHFIGSNEHPVKINVRSK